MLHTFTRITIARLIILALFISGHGVCYAQNNSTTPHTLSVPLEQTLVTEFVTTLDSLDRATYNRRINGIHMAFKKLESLPAVSSFTAKGKMAIQKWLASSPTITPHDRTPFAKLIVTITSLTSYAHTERSAEKIAYEHWIHLLASKWSLSPRQTKVLITWLYHHSNLVELSPEKLCDLVHFYVHNYQKFPHLRKDFHYPVTTTGSEDQKITNLITNAQVMKTRFSEEFVKADISYVAPIEGTDYFIALRNGSESTFGITAYLGRYTPIHTETKRTVPGVDTRCLFFRIGIDEEGKSLRITQIQGFQNATHLMNGSFREDMGLTTANALLLIALEFAHYYGYAEILGIDPALNTSYMKSPDTNLPYNALYRSFGLRTRRRPFGRFKSTEDLISRWREKAAQSERVARGMLRMRKAFRNLRIRYKNGTDGSYLFSQQTIPEKKFIQAA